LLVTELALDEVFYTVCVCAAVDEVFYTVCVCAAV